MKNEKVELTGHTLINWFFAPPRLSAIVQSLEKLGKLLTLKESYRLGVYCREITSNPRAQVLIEKRDEKISEYVNNKVEEFKKSARKKKPDIKEKELENQAEQVRRSTIMDEIPGLDKFLKEKIDIDVKRHVIPVKAIKRFPLPKDRELTDEDLKRYQQWNLLESDFRNLLNFIDFEGEWPED